MCNCLDGCGECVPQLKKPHIHAAFIKAWADGALIEYHFCDDGGSRWVDCAGRPTWSPTRKYRVKPEPKPDVIVNATMTFTNAWASPAIYASWTGSVPEGYKHHLSDERFKRVQFIVDGETGELKSVSIVRG